MTFRKVTKNEIESIVEMIADDELGKSREKFQIPLPKEYYAAFENINNDANQELIVVENEDLKIIGTFQLSFIQYLTYCGGIRAQIEGVRVHNDFRRIGLGEKIFKWAIERAKQKDAHVLQLTTDKKRPDAIQFYKKLGFVSSHEGMKLYFN